jgi:hypothetical protein
MFISERFCSRPLLRWLLAALVPRLAGSQPQSSEAPTLTHARRASPDAVG